MAGLFPRWKRILEMLPAFVNSTISPFTSTKGGVVFGVARAVTLLSDIVREEVRVKSNLGREEQMVVVEEEQEARAGGRSSLHCKPRILAADRRRTSAHLRSALI